MTFVKILAPLTGGARDHTVLSSAFAAARPFNAHVAALFVRPDATEAVPFYGESVSANVMQEIADASKKASDEAIKVARASLQAAAKEAGAAVQDVPELGSAPTASFREVTGNFADQVTLAARLSDLVVFGALKEGDRPGLTEAFEATLLETGRPVLLSAQAAPSSFCMKKVSVAWNDSVASAHAVTAALPFLKCAQSVEILSVTRGKDEPIGCSDVCAYLKLQGIAATERKVDGGNRPIADVLLKAASEGGAGMLVAGGYGHNRLREMFFSGVTRQVVSHADLPVFLVH
ncbi:MAG: universal stress protein [Alphaproteobacteria bacterium]|nr:universal stress protein [Alphaproteobacteria bacterium]MBL7098660.1 universal stress protein [Alphaproteobacteria bacterium]